MADRKISDLTALTTPASGDFLPIVDISEAAAASKNKRITIEELMRGMPDGTAAAPSIAFESDPNTGIYRPGADQVAISTNGQGRLFIDSSGRLLAGTSTARSNFFGTTLSSLTQIEGTGGSTARGALSVLNNDVSNNPPYVLLGRSGAATIGSNAAVVSGSRLGTLTFHGADGTSFIEAATVAGEVDGTPGSNDMPGRLVFSTTSDNAGSPTERMRLDSSGRLGLGTSAPNAGVHSVIADGLFSFAGSGATKGLRIEHTSAESRLVGVDATLSASYQPLVMRGSTLGFDTNGTTRAITIDASQRVGIGTSSPGSALEINAAAATSPFIAKINTAEAARIDSSGRLLVGTSTSTMSGGTVQQNRNLGIVANDATNVANNGTLDIVINSAGGCYSGFLIVENTTGANAAIRTQTTYAVLGRGTSATATSIATLNGSTSGASFTLTYPSTGTIRVTNTSGGTTNINMAWFGPKGY